MNVDQFTEKLCLSKDIIWKWIPEYEGMYLVGNNGDIRTVRIAHFGKIICKKLSKGYYQVSLNKNSTQKTKSLHRLVAQAFIPNPENKLEVNHKNGIKTDNRVENLEWMTRSENAQHSYDNGLQVIGEHHKQRARETLQKHKPWLKLQKLTIAQANEIRAKYVTGMYKQLELAKEYNVNRKTIYMLIKGKRYKL